MVLEQITARQALEKLLAGNRRMAAGGASVPYDMELAHRLEREGQHPIATVICCSDSRVPPELVFGCGLGEVFVVRSAGNVLDHFEVGSVEYGVTDLHTPLVLVLGHSGCGAVAAAMEGSAPGYLGELLGEIAPSVEEAGHLARDRAEQTRLAEDLNIRRSVARLRADPLLSPVPGLEILGAKYDQHTGLVEVLEC